MFFSIIYLCIYLFICSVVHRFPPQQRSTTHPSDIWPCTWRWCRSWPLSRLTGDSSWATWCSGSAGCSGRSSCSWDMRRPWQLTIFEMLKISDENYRGWCSRVFEGRIDREGIMRRPPVKQTNSVQLLERAGRWGIDCVHRECWNKEHNRHCCCSHTIKISIEQTGHWRYREIDK